MYRIYDQHKTILPSIECIPFYILPGRVTTGINVIFPRRYILSTTLGQSSQTKGL